MVLGEEVLFHDAEDADVLVKFVRKKNFNAARKTRNVLIPVVGSSGTIKNFIALLDEAISSPEIAPGEEQRAYYLEIRGEMEERKKNLTEILSTYHPGEIVSSEAEKGRLKSMMERLLEAEGGETITEEDQHFVESRLQSLALLWDNQLVEITQEGLRLTGSVNPEDAVIGCPIEYFNDLDESLLSKHGIGKRVTVASESEFIVTLGPEFVFMEDGVELDELVSHLEVDEFSYEKMLMNLMIKRIIVERILDLVKSKGKVSKGDIIDELKMFHADFPDMNEHISFILHQDLIGEVVDDLRKLGALQGKDHKIKCAL